MKLSCVILTMGNRPAELDRAVASAVALSQAADGVDVVVVGNGADVPPLPPGRAPSGCRRTSAWRAAGTRAWTRAPVTWCCSSTTTAGTRIRAWGSTSPAGSRPTRTWPCSPSGWSIPTADPACGGTCRGCGPVTRAGHLPVTTFAGGACAIRRSAFHEAGGLPALFFYGHEETDLAWRLLGLGYRLEYDAAARICHPAVPNARHATWYRLDGRNRVLLARRNLPWPVAGAYLLNWLALTVVRERSASAVRAWLSGFAEGWRLDAGGRRPISARTAWRMTRTGRPPVI